MRPTIVIADRELHYLSSVEAGLFAGCRVVQATNSEQVLCELRETSGVCLLLIDPSYCGNSFSLLRGIRAQGRRNDKVVFTAENPTVELVIRAFKAGVRDFIRKPAAHSALVEMVEQLIRGTERMPSYWARRLDRYLIDNLSNPNLNLAALQSQFSVSKSYLSKLFRAEIGVPFRQRLMRYRMLKATELIETTDYPIYLISHHCGFRNQCRLTEAFTRFHGLGPRRYRETHRSQVLSLD